MLRASSAHLQEDTVVHMQHMVLSSNELLPMPMVCVRSYLKCILRYKFLIFDTSYLREQGCEDPWLFSEAKRDPRAKTFRKHWRTVWTF